ERNTHGRVQTARTPALAEPPPPPSVPVTDSAARTPFCVTRTGCGVAQAPRTAERRPARMDPMRVAAGPLDVHPAPAVSPAAVRAGRPGRLTYHPALDGLRGVAVLAVLLFHAGHLRGGFLGVDLFFTLSGFLITSLLLAEHSASGRISLRNFWSRRARRLLP